MVSKAKKRKRSARRRLNPVVGGTNIVSKKEETGVDLSWIKKGLLRSLISSLLALMAILAVYFLSQNNV